MSEDVQLPPELADELGMNDTPETFIAELDTLREEIAATATDDLQLLADVHTRMQKLRDRLAEVPGVEDDVQEAAARQADKAATLLEALILNDTDNAEALLEDVSATAMIVQCVLDGTCPPDAAMADADAEGADTSAIAADPNGGDFSTFQQALSDDGDEEDDDDADYVPASFPTATLPEITMAPAAAPAPTAAADAPADDLTPFAIDAEDAPLCAEFVTEANGHLEQAEQDLLTLEDDPTNKDAIDSCFRAFHTIKGVAGFLNLKQVQELAHATETLLDRGREGKLQLTGTASDLVLASLDLMKQLVADIDSGSGGSPITPRTGVAQQAQWCNDFVDAVERGENPNIDVKRPSDTVAEEAPTEERRAGEDRRKDDRRSSGDGTVKVNTDRLDSLIDMVGELVIAQSMVSQDVAGLGETDQRLGRNLGHLGKIVRELQDLSMSLRMVQVGNVFRKMQRVVRDTARKIDKQVELVITGGDTELDRNVVDALADPLVHMVRNSVDHGIETPAERADFGKNPVGTVELKAYHKGGS
ncbi:MAG: Hpt domain-containing protein, partial [Planctomycetota bacterium]